MAELGETDDPKELIPGSVSAIADMVWALGDYRDSLESAGEGLRRIDTAEGWSGDAADAFHDSYDGEPKKWLVASDCFDVAAKQLDAYASTLQWAQGVAQTAIDNWNRGQAATKKAQGEYDHAAKTAPPGTTMPPFEDPGADARAAAVEQLRNVRQTLRDAGDDANRAIGAARDKAPEKPGFWSKVGGALSGAADWVVNTGKQIGADTINALASYGNALIHHPEDIASILGGALMTGIGTGIEGGGIVLDATGVGAIVGVPANIAGGAMIAGGVTLMAAGGIDAGNHAANEDRVEPVKAESEPPPEYQGKSGTKTDRLKEHLTEKDLDAARRELKGEVVARKSDGTPWDHVNEVRDAQQGLRNQIIKLQRMVNDTRISPEARAEAQRELSEASKLYDHTKGYVPPK